MLTIIPASFALLRPCLRILRAGTLEIRVDHACRYDVTYLTILITHNLNLPVGILEMQRHRRYNAAARESWTFSISWHQVDTHMSHVPTWVQSLCPVSQLSNLSGTIAIVKVVRIGKAPHYGQIARLSEMTSHHQWGPRFPKSILHEFYQVQGGSPCFSVVSGEPPSTEFTCHLIIPAVRSAERACDEERFTATGRNKKSAEHAAAALALEHLIKCRPDAGACGRCASAKASSIAHYQ